MLASRICLEGNVIVMETTRVKKVLPNMYKEPIASHVVKRIGRQLGLDFALSGSLTKEGQNVSIDAKMFDIKEKTPPVSLFVTGEGMNEVIPKINDFAMQANARITSKAYPERSISPASAGSKASDFISEFLSSQKPDEGDEER